MSIIEYSMAIGCSNAVVAAALAAFVIPFTLRRRRAPLAHFLWLLILAKLVTPPLFDLPIRSVQWSQSEALTERQSSPAAKAGHIPLAMHPATVADDDGAARLAVHPAKTKDDSAGRDALLALAAEPAPTSSAAPTAVAENRIELVFALANQQTWLRVLFAVWAAGTLMLMSLAVVRIGRFQRLVRRASLAPRELRIRVARVARIADVRAVPDVRVCTANVVPMVFSTGGRSILLMPEALLSSLSEDEQSTMIAHELAHLRRHDHWTNWFALLVVTLYWWHPVVWFAQRKLRETADECCDGWVVSWFPDKSRAYAQSMLKVLDFLADGARPAAGLANGFGQLNSLKRRFEMVLNQGTNYRLTWPLQCVMSVVAPAVILLSPMLSVALTSEPESPSRLQPAEEALEKGIAGTVGQHETGQPGQKWGHFKGRFVLAGEVPEVQPISITKDRGLFGDSVVDESLLVDPESKGIANVLVFVRAEGVTVHPDYAAAGQAPFALTYAKGSIQPRLSTIRTSQPVEIRNADPVAHNVKIDTFRNRPQNVLLPPNGNLKWSFASPERRPAAIADSIHPWERGWLLIRDHPYAVVTDANGDFELRNLPQGELEFQCWHERSGWLVAKPEWSKGVFRITIGEGTHDIGDIEVPSRLFARRSTELNVRNRAPKSSLFDQGHSTRDATVKEKVRLREAAVRALVTALNDRNAQVREEVEATITYIVKSQPSKVGVFIEMVAAAESIQARKAAVRAIGLAGSHLTSEMLSDVATALVLALTDPTLEENSGEARPLDAPYDERDYLLLQTITTIKKIDYQQDERVRDELSAALFAIAQSEEKPYLRAAAAGAIGHTGGRIGLRAATQLLGDGVGEVRLAAAGALRQLMAGQE